MQQLPWPSNSPDSLADICLEFCATNLEKTLCDRTTDGAYTFKPDIYVPPSLGDALLGAFSPVRHQHLGLLRDPSVLNARHINVKTVDDLTHDELCWALAHRPTELRLSWDGLTARSLQALNSSGVNLQTLCISNCSNLFSSSCSPCEELCDETQSLKSDADRRPCCLEICGETCQNICGIDCPKLRWLSLNGADLQSRPILSNVLSDMPALVRLDLSDSTVDFNCLGGGLSQLPLLHILCLHNVPLDDNLQKSFAAISSAKSLRVLDIGHSSSDEPVIYQDVDKQMHLLTSNLPHLKWLDIAGTNLAGFVSAPVVSHRLCPPTSSTEHSPCQIPGLVNRSLDYLGLLNCSHRACERENLPAKQVTGTANEQQIILSVHSYIDRKPLLLLALNSLYHVFKHAECNDQFRALEGILMAMKQYVSDKSIQISGSATLFYIVKGTNKHLFTTKIKKTIIRTLIVGMENHLNEPTMLRNCCLTFCHFRVPLDVIHTYERLVTVLLTVIQSTSSPDDNFIQRITVYLLNSLSCQVDYHEKQLVGHLGAFPVILQLIKGRVVRGVCDEVMEVAWSMLWNVTDETAYNCKLFIEGNGLDIFVECFEKFKVNHDELLRNMMGLLGNVAEVDFLRPHLMNKLFVSIFRDLLFSVSDGIEVSYNACGVLAHMMSDGQQAWTVTEPSRQLVLVDMCKAIAGWTLKSKRNINYRSFKPILRLITCYETPEVQYWAIWALCNLTKVYRTKYCPLLEKEGGIQLLNEFCHDQRSDLHPEVKKLALQVIDRCQHFSQDSSYGSDNDDEK